MMRSSIHALALIGLTGCGVLNLNPDDQNDTQLGDDDGNGETGGEPEPDPNQVPDHGPAQYCVDRWAFNASANPEDLLLAVRADMVAIHERWWSPPTRSYVNHLDISDKPSPMVVPPMCGAFDPLWEDSWDQHGRSCLVSGYHVPLPGVVTTPDPGGVQWPYAANIVTGTIGNPPESGRHTWMAEPCCSTPPTPMDVIAWAELPGEESLYLGNRNADCALHAMFKGSQTDVAGYYSPHDTTARRYRTATGSECVSNHVIYNPAKLAPYKASAIGQWLPMHPTRKQHTAPLNLNYEWVSSWGLIEWEDFAAFGATIDAVVAALLSVLYLPPDGFAHPRYGGGSGCWYPATIKYGPSGWYANITCPYGYYDVLPDFNGADLETQIDGVAGHCALDGLGGGGPYGDGVGPIVAVPAEVSGHPHMYYVTRINDVAEAIDASWAAGSVTPEMALLFVDTDGTPVLREGDTIAWYSTPGVDSILPGDALTRTLEYDVDALMKATGWTRSRAEAWADTAPPVLLSVLLPDIELPRALASRRGSDLRARNTWRFRVERDDGTVMVLYVRAA